MMNIEWNFLWLKFWKFAVISGPFEEKLSGRFKIWWYWRISFWIYNFAIRTIIKNVEIPKMYQQHDCWTFDIFFQVQFMYLEWFFGYLFYHLQRRVCLSATELNVFGLSLVFVHKHIFISYSYCNTLYTVQRVDFISKSIILW